METCRHGLALVESQVLEVLPHLFCQQVVVAEHGDALSFACEAAGFPLHQQGLARSGDPFDLHARIAGDGFHQHFLEGGGCHAGPGFHFPEFGPAGLVEAAQKTDKSVIVFVAQLVVREGLSAI